MPAAYCKICGETKTHYSVDANCILIDLECGHVLNWADGALLHKSQFLATFGATTISAPKVGIRAFGVIGSLTSLVQNIGSSPNS